MPLLTCLKQTPPCTAGTLSAVVAAAAVVAGWALALDYSAKLFVMTFVIVLMTNETPDASDAFLIASTRVFGILLGVFLSLVLSVIVFPKSASHQVAPVQHHACSHACAQLGDTQQPAAKAGLLWSPDVRAAVWQDVRLTRCHTCLHQVASSDTGSR